jgi:hypothetical protein
MERRSGEPMTVRSRIHQRVTKRLRPRGPAAADAISTAPSGGSVTGNVISGF